MAKKSRKSSSPKPKNPALYARVKAAAKRKFKVYPSAYANAWLVREYKFKEDWRDVKTGKKCGRSGKKDKGRPYPACRPKSKASSASAKRAAKRKTGPARISWKAKSKKGKK